MEDILNEISQYILEGNTNGVQEKVMEAVSAGLEPDLILKTGLISAMSEVGRLYEVGEFYVPEMLVAARAMQAGLKVLKPSLVAADVKPIAKVALGTVRGDLHDIGKNLVGMMLEGAGFEVIDLGVDVSPGKFVEIAREGNVNIIAMSALLTTTMTNMKDTINAIGEAGLRNKIRIIIGGAPITEEYAHDIGADGYASNAGQAATLAKSLIS